MLTRLRKVLNDPAVRELFDRSSVIAQLNRTPGPLSACRGPGERMGVSCEDAMFSATKRAMLVFHHEDGVQHHAEEYAMGIDDLINKGKEFLNDEQQSDKLLDGASSAANKVTGDKFKDQIKQGRDFLDGQLGDERKQ